MIEPYCPPVTIIIPNFNGAHLLRRNLPSVIKAAAEYPGKCPVLVVDDGSGDDSAEVLRAEFPAVGLIRHETNRGFAEAIRSGTEAAGTELLIFLNSDVRPEAGFIAPLVRHFESPDIFSVAPLVVDENGQASEVSWRCFRIRRARFRAVPWRYDASNPKVLKSLYASGGSMALRKSMFMALGGFLPIFQPFYSEDSDLGMRAWRRGWRTLFDPESRITHGASGSIKENIAACRIRKTRGRNRFLLEWIHVPARDLIFFLVPGYVFQCLSRLVKFDSIYFAGLFAALRRLPEALKIRAEIEKTAVLGFWEIMDSIERDAESGTGSPDSRTTPNLR
jgi:GT2 family glycosyltransferase